MKTARLLAMATGGLDVGIELETPSTPRERPHGNGRSVAAAAGPLASAVNPSIEQQQRSHSRSASWSFTRGQVLNPIAPITSVIREFVPSLSQISRSARNATSTGTIRIPESPQPSRTSSRESLLRGSGGSSTTSEGSGERERETGDHDRRREGGGGGGGASAFDDDDDPLEMWGDSNGSSGNNGNGTSRTLGDPSANVSVHVPRGHNRTPSVPTAGTNGHQNGNEEQNTGMEVSDALRWLERNAIFIILLLVKFAWYHRSGLMVILGMFGTYLHCDQTIRKQVALKNRREKKVLLFITLFLLGNMVFVYYVFWEQRLHNCLIFQAPHFTVDLWNLIWSVWVTDYIIRFITMGLKSLIAAMFFSILPSRKKGKWYMLLEYVSQFYRTLAPTPLWVRYLSNQHLSGAVFAVLITATYLMIKGGVIFSSVRELYGAFINFLKDPVYGTSPTKEDMDQANNTCAICHEDFSRPIMLGCRHIFCENCVLQWLDRQNSCPLCRAAVANYDPKWRDGSTAKWPQIF